jgi:WS/DGAT/MGAT family acyltransferase
MAYSLYERLTAIDAAFLSVEDECCHMHIGSVSIFDAGPLAVHDNGVDIDRIRELIRSRLHKTPRFRQRIAYAPLTAAPVWIDDPSFNLDYHVRHTALPHPGDIQQLQRLASRIMSQRLDRRRPLWEFWVVEGLEGNRFALISKIHHAMADGISGVDLAGAIIGKDPDFRSESAPEWIPRPAPDGRDVFENEIKHQLRTAWDLARDGATSRPAPKEDTPADSFYVRLRKTVGAASEWMEAAPSTPFNVEIGPNRRFEWLRMDFDFLNEIRSASGAKLNDVVLAIVAGAVRSFLLRRDCPIRGLDFRVMVPVSVRSTDERGHLGNRVSQLVVHLPIDSQRPVERLRLIRSSTSTLKKSGQTESGELLTTLAELFPPRLASVLERWAARRSLGNMIVTNVPGAPFTAYLLGARLLESYPLVPLSAHQALNVAVLSYDDHLHWGINADYDAFPDVSDFVILLQEEAEQLHKDVQAAGSPSRVKLRNVSAPGGSSPRSTNQALP